MAKSTYKKKNAQPKSRVLDRESQYDDLLATLLSSVGLNKFEVNKRFKVGVKDDGVIDLEIDLHRLRADDTESILLKLLSSRALNIRTITLIHGFNHGIILKEYLKYDFNNDRISAKMNDSTNEGITILKIKPWDKKKSKHRQVIKQQAKSGNRGLDKKYVPGIEEAKNDARFKLQMIKENLKATKIKSRKYNDEFSSVLTDMEKQYSKEIFNYDFDLNFFMNNLLEFCIFEEITYMKIRYKKKTMDEVVNLVEKLTENRADEKFIIMFEVAKVVMKRLDNENILASKDYVKCEFQDHSLVISNVLL